MYEYNETVYYLYVRLVYILFLLYVTQWVWSELVESHDLKCVFIFIHSSNGSILATVLSRVLGRKYIFSPVLFDLLGESNTQLYTDYFTDLSCCQKSQKAAFKSHQRQNVSCTNSEENSFAALASPSPSFQQWMA